MGSKARKTRKFAEVKRMLNPKDLKSKQCAPRITQMDWRTSGLRDAFRAQAHYVCMPCKGLSGRRRLTGRF